MRKMILLMLNRLLRLMMLGGIVLHYKLGN